jgi:hypothetical protein
LEIQKIFTKIRNAINDREDELLSEVDKNFEELFLNENIIKDSEKLPAKIKLSLDKGKLIRNNSNDVKLNFLINDCLNIENNIFDISKINGTMKNYKISQNNFIFNQNEKESQRLFELYERKGSFDLEHQLPIIMYSSLISIFLDTLLKLLALSNDEIISFKQDKKRKRIKKRGKYLENKLNIKFVLYFIISFIFLLFFWYYISMFGAIYRNTQIHLLKDTLLSFGLSLLYPFGICLLPGFFRIQALSDLKRKENIYIILVRYFKCFD